MSHTWLQKLQILVVVLPGGYTADGGTRVTELLGSHSVYVVVPGINSQVHNYAVGKLPLSAPSYF